MKNTLYLKPINMMRFDMKIQSLRGSQPHNTSPIHNYDVRCTGLCPGTSVKRRDWLETSPLNNNELFVARKCYRDGSIKWNRKSFKEVPFHVEAKNTWLARFSGRNTQNQIWRIWNKEVGQIATPDFVTSYKMRGKMQVVTNSMGDLWNVIRRCEKK